NQIRCHIGYRSSELIKYCQRNKIAITAYSPLAKKELFNYSRVQEIANELNRTSAQVALRWLVQQEILVIPKASSKQHLQDNLGIFDWHLTSAQVDQLNQIQ
ncbi:MAG: aldo/keto reductase, partial [Candidatus Poribacteria bacterium]|nr:aldo/keto reductase [Candidatus Poribacteria bacterium]